MEAFRLAEGTPGLETEAPAPPPELRLIEQSPLFDAAWYATRHPEVSESGLAPALHYLRSGAGMGFAPSPGFDGADYLRRYPDLAARGANPLVHFLLHGQKEGRKIAAADPEEIQARLVAASGLFDEEWYLAAYPQARGSGLGPIRHFIRHGRAEGHNPSPRFDAAAYIAAYKDVASSAVNPLLHYLQFGRAEGRAISAVQPPVPEPAAAPEPAPAVPPVPEPEASAPPPPLLAAEPQDAPAAPAPAEPAAPAPEPGSREAAHARLILDSGLFDAEWYLQKNPDAAASGLAPEIHFLRIGGPAGQPPSPGFDAAAYLQQHSDVRDTGLNPLVHYLLHGRNEQRGVRPFDPAEVLARLVARSGYFDEGWYLHSYPDVAQSGLPALQFFLMHGRDLGHNPGPYFDSAFYVASYKDLQASRINPLVHYLQFGYAEGRAIQPVHEAAATAEAEPERQVPGVQPAPPAAAPPSVRIEPLAMPALPTPEDVELVEASPLFDKAWYFNKYPDAARAGISAAEHYLRFGASELRQPSLYFDPQYYVVEQSPEIQQTGINPLLHYILEGQGRGRKPRALFDFVPSPGMAKPLDRAAWPIVDAEHGLAAPATHWTAQADIETDPHLATLQLGGTPVAAARQIEALAPHEAKLSLLAELSGFDPAHELFGHQEGRWTSTLVPSAELADFACFGPELTSGRHRIADLWFAGGHTLRIRLGDDGQEPAPLMVLRVFQIAASGTAMPALLAETALGTSGASFIDAALVNPLLPVLLVLSEPSGEAVETGVLPFPSLCRGGLHHAELAGSEDFTNPVARLASLSARYAVSLLAARRRGTGFAVSGIEVGLAGATGAEAIFQPQVRNWLAQVFGVTVEPVGAAEGNPAGEAYLREALTAPAGHPQAGFRRTGQSLLSLPADAVPTIGALSEPAGAAARPLSVASYYVADPGSLRPRLSVVLPPLGEDFLALQPEWAAHGLPVLTPANGGEAAAPPAASGHAAIRFPRSYEGHRALMLMPRAPAEGDTAAAGGTPEEAAVDAFVRAGDAGELRRFLESLLRQQGIFVSFVTVEGLAGQADEAALAAVLAELVPGRGGVVMRRKPAPLGPRTRRAGNPAALTLIADAAIVLHDGRTAQTLVSLLRGESTASASCVVIREAMSKKGSLLNFESGGFFPSHISLAASPRLILSQPDCRGAFANATYPVIANTAGLVVVKTALLDTYGDAEEGTADGIAFALRAAGAGLMHLCTSAVRAASVRDEQRLEKAEPPGIEAVGAHRWADVLGTIALVREIQ